MNVVAQPSEWSIFPVPARRLSPILSVFGRLKPGVDVTQASAELAVIHRRYVVVVRGMLDAKPNSTERGESAEGSTGSRR